MKECVALRVEFLLKTESGYRKDAEVTLFYQTEDEENSFNLFSFFLEFRKKFSLSFSFSHFLFLRHRIMCYPGPLPKG